MNTMAMMVLALILAAGCDPGSELPTVPACRDGHGYGLVITSCPTAPGCAACLRETANGSRAPLGEQVCRPPAAYGVDVICVESCDACPAVGP